MNWNHFLQALGAAYLLYYMLLIVWDLANLGKIAKKQPELLEFVFQAEEQPVQVTVAEVPGHQHNQTPTSNPSPQAVSVGGTSAGAINMAGLIDQARSEVGEYTRDIPY